MHITWMGQGTAQTGAYMIAGYGVIFGVILIYKASLVVRRRKLRNILELLREVEKNGHTGA